MYIVAIAWLYVTILMAATEATLLAGISTFLLYGLLPCSIVMYLMGAPGRRRAIKAREAAELEALALQQQASDSGMQTVDQQGSQPRSEPDQAGLTSGHPVPPK